MKTSLRKCVSTRVISTSDSTIVWYHSTPIVAYYPKTGNAVLTTKGWRTATTKKRMNQVSAEYNLGFTIFQRKWNWYVRLDSGEVLDYEDFMIIKIPKRKEA